MLVVFITASKLRSAQDNINLDTVTKTRHRSREDLLTRSVKLFALERKHLQCKKLLRRFLKIPLPFQGNSLTLYGAKMQKCSPCYLPGDGAACAPEDLGAHAEADLPVAGVDVGGLVAGQHGAAVDVGLAVQHREPRPVLYIQNHTDLPSTAFCRACFY